MQVYPHQVSASVFLTLALTLGVSAQAAEVGARRAKAEAFQLSGETPPEYADPSNPDLLPPNVSYPPTDVNRAFVVRTARCVQYIVETSGLPPGAYTNWLLVVNKPDKCRGIGECGMNEFFEDLFNPANDGAGFFATGGVVGADGRGSFRHKVCRGDDLGFPGEWMATGDISRCRDGEECGQQKVIGPQHLFGQLGDPRRAAFGVVVKYHGKASDDATTLYDQTHTLLGSCAAGANGHPGPPPIVQCFDPQMVVFPLP